MKGMTVVSPKSELETLAGSEGGAPTPIACDWCGRGSGSARHTVRVPSRCLPAP